MANNEEYRAKMITVLSGLHTPFPTDGFASKRGGNLQHISKQQIISRVLVY